MSTHDNAPPPEGWHCEPRECPRFDRDPKVLVAVGDEHLILGEN